MVTSGSATFSVSCIGEQPAGHRTASMGASFMLSKNASVLLRAAADVAKRAAPAQRVRGDGAPARRLLGLARRSFPLLPSSALRLLPGLRPLLAQLRLLLRHHPVALLRRRLQLCVGERAAVGEQARRHRAVALAQRVAERRAAPSGAALGAVPAATHISVSRSVRRAAEHHAATVWPAASRVRASARCRSCDGCSRGERSRARIAAAASVWCVKTTACIPGPFALSALIVAVRSSSASRARANHLSRGVASRWCV